MPKIDFDTVHNNCEVQFTPEEIKSLEDVKLYLGFNSIEEVIEDALKCYITSCDAHFKEAKDQGLI